MPTRRPTAGHIRCWAMQCTQGNNAPHAHPPHPTPHKARPPLLALRPCSSACPLSTLPPSALWCVCGVRIDLPRPPFLAVQRPAPQRRPNHHGTAGQRQAKATVAARPGGTRYVGLVPFLSPTCILPSIHLIGTYAPPPSLFLHPLHSDRRGPEHPRALHRPPLPVLGVATWPSPPLLDADFGPCLPHLRPLLLPTTQKAGEGRRGRPGANNRARPTPTPRTHDRTSPPTHPPTTTPRRTNEHGPRPSPPPTPLPLRRKGYVHPPTHLTQPNPTQPNPPNPPKPTHLHQATSPKPKHGGPPRSNGGRRRTSTASSSSPIPRLK